MATSSMREDISQYFGESVASDDELTSACISMCQMFNLTVETLSFKWQAISYNNTQKITPFTLASAGDLKTRIQRELKLNAENKKFGNSKFSGGLDGGLKVVLRSKPTRTIEHRDHSDIPRVSFQCAEPEPEPYRYMYEKISERSEALDDRIDIFADLVQKHYNLEELADPASTTEDVVHVVGRIVLDAETSSSGAKLNEASLVLESSRMMGSGARVPIRFQDTKIRGGQSGVGGVGLFPGAIVATKGRNGGGGCFVVEELLNLPPLPQSPLLPQDMGSSFSMCIACGPFTSDLDLDYKPWKNLLTTLKSSKPAVVLLLGPFVDSTHPSIKNGDLDKTPDDIFTSQFTDGLNSFLSASPGSTILLVPSVRDITSDHTAFPQGRLDRRGLDPGIKLLPNPCRFSLNGIKYAVSSVDVLFHLRKDELFKRGTEVDPLPSPSGVASDPMSNLCRHVLQQRSFYPIFPAPLDLAHEVNIDISHSDRLKLVDGAEPFAPDVLIAPSRLKHFSKVVDHTVSINPSFLSKGTYATLSFNGQGSGPTVDRITVDLPHI